LIIVGVLSLVNMLELKILKMMVYVNTVELNGATAVALTVN
jgi:hypothetical protein